MGCCNLIEIHSSTSYLITYNQDRLFSLIERKISQKVLVHIINNYAIYNNKKKRKKRIISYLKYIVYIYNKYL